MPIHLLAFQCLGNDVFLTFLDPFHLFADQKNGLIFDVWRKDGGSFSGSVINVKYHAAETTGVV